MNKNKRNFLISGILVLISSIFTILVKTVNVQPIGESNTNVGFSAINQFVFNLTGVNMIWYHITDLLGTIPIIMSVIYALAGLTQLIKRKSLFKVDKEILALGAFYIVTMAMYIFFENVIINYRPILINGYLEASYPSSHTLMAICLCASSIMVNKRLFNNKFTKAINGILVAIIIITIVGRLLSGVHWLTDILGGIIISSAMLMLFYSAIFMFSKK